MSDVTHLTEYNTPTIQSLIVGRLVGLLVLLVGYGGANGLFLLSLLSSNVQIDVWVEIAISFNTSTSLH